MTEIGQPNESPTIRLAIADDQQLVRSGFAMVIDSQPDMEVVFEASDGEQILRLAKFHPVDVVLMDIRMPNLDGIQATQKLLEMYDGLGNPQCKVIILTTYDLDDYVSQAIKAGASGFILKDASPEELLRAIRTVHNGDAVLAPSTTRRLMERLEKLLPGDEETFDKQIFSSLTERELEVLRLMARGYSNNEISTTLFISEATVKTHASRIFEKLGLRDRVQAVILAYRAKIVSL